ncbi:MAG: hypothetical protein INQ03_13820 [Candidatus Heimdallarchaeota archaeon]|nr:hypothetical protein [Candidatus Heimdallarchaeota archaeon]
MKTYITLISIFSLFLIFSIPVSAQGIGAQTSNGIVTLDTDKIVIEIKGGSNIPSFFFHEVGEDTETYKLQLDAIMEVVDNNSNGIYDLDEDKKVASSIISLATLNWEFSDLVEEKDGEEVTAVHFNITSTSEGAGNNPTSDELFMQFRMHMDLNNSAEIKFDVVIDGYEFIEDNSIFVLAFKLTTTNNENIVQSQNKFEFGKGYFESEEKASDVSGETKVAVSYGEEQSDKKIYLAYEQFDGLMIHDPIIGLNLDSDAAFLDFTSIGLISIALLTPVLIKKRN